MKDLKKENILYLLDCSEFELKEPHGGRLNRIDEKMTIERGDESLYKIKTKDNTILIDKPAIFLETVKIVEKKMGLQFFN